MKLLFTQYTYINVIIINVNNISKFDRFKNLF